MLCVLLIAAVAQASVVLYGSPMRVNGSIGNRAAATALCMQNKPARCNFIHAGLSYTGDDVVDLIETSVGPVVGPTGVLIADTWGGFWSGAIAATLEAAGVISSPIVFTGTNPGGRASQHNCREWTADDLVAGGRAGRKRWNGTRAISGGRNHCWNTAQFLCVCNRRLATELQLYQVEVGALLDQPMSLAQADAHCGAAGSRSTYAGETTSFLGCINPGALMCGGSGMDMTTFLERHGYSPTAQVDNPGLFLHAWATYINGDFPEAMFAVGCRADGTTGLNCANFTTTDGMYETPDGMTHACTDLMHPVTLFLCMCPEGNESALVTLAPTPPPTITSNVYIYGINVNVTLGALGDRAAADAYCAAAWEYPSYYDGSYSYFAACGIHAALLCYGGGDDVANLPETHGFNPNATVHFPYNFGGGPWASWGDFVATGFDAVDYGQGCLANGSFSGSNCGDFNQTDGAYYTQPGMEYELRPCTALNVPMVCACAELETFTPDPTPEIVMYGVPVAAIDAVRGRRNADQLCSTGLESPNNYYNESAFLGCRNVAALLCYAGDGVANLPETHQLNRSARVLFPYTTPPIEFDGWDAFVQSGFFVTFGSSLGQGCDATGTFAGNNCNNFFSNTGSYDLPSGETSSCSDTSIYITCACAVDNTLSPFPTTYPTVNPTVAPETTAPSAAPTAAPRKLYSFFTAPATTLTTIDTQAGGNAHCLANAQLSAVGCGRAFQVACYGNGHDISTLAADNGIVDTFSTLIPTDAYGTVVEASGGFAGAFAAALGSGMAQINGCNADGTTAANNYSGCVANPAHAHVLTLPTHGNIMCAAPWYSGCICTPGPTIAPSTAAPTIVAPTVAPVIAPSTSPTFQPTPPPYVEFLASCQATCISDGYSGCYTDYVETYGAYHIRACTCDTMDSYAHANEYPNKYHGPQHDPDPSFKLLGTDDACTSCTDVCTPPARCLQCGGDVRCRDTTEDDSCSPTVSPTAAPSAQPTTGLPTTYPTTGQPTSPTTGAPTAYPAPPSEAPSEQPTFQP